MQFIDWSSKLAVNAADIDNQHKKLVDIINELYSAMQGGKGAAVMGKVLGELIGYTKDHFAYEEKLMVQHKYNDNNKHKLEHDKLTKQVLDLQKQFTDGKMVVTVEVMNFLKKWLNDHILDKDKTFAAFLNQKGVH
ncbi:MAG: bacteriohemerythrin [Candidatus Magnetobacterium sp. LHC-1]|uniref:Hemerythrin family protein n=1 Tax=Candidatus Magnetobacterium casense TaxID=1455061 RepID=A0ABS6RUU9_9BACT|nr:bacteriohemerythrin [Candidatus Magnetobacterium casensis]MBF0606786.1 hemerythrin family protein [Nitrospirota bacterium]MBV6340410.1 hemerythrin family protein [Candidatus Magnetobacterium casensis]